MDVVREPTNDGVLIRLTDEEALQLLSLTGRRPNRKDEGELVSLADARIGKNAVYQLAAKLHENLPISPSLQKELDLMPEILPG